MQDVVPYDLEDDFSLCTCSLLTTSTATTLNNVGAGRTLGYLITRGGVALERVLGNIAVKLGRSPAAAGERVHKSLGFSRRASSSSRKIDRLVERDMTRLVDYTQ